jgi:PKD repeat protein
VKPGDTVHFTDLSNEAEAWEWDFDNDGFVDSYEQNPVYSYQNLGFYTVMLSITGAGGIIQDYGIRYDYIHVDDLNNTDFVERMENKINIFPNPLRDHLNISINSDQDCTLNLTIYNSNGKLVRLFKQKKMAAQSLISIPISDLQNGIYFVNMSTPEQSQTKKVIINN